MLDLHTYEGVEKINEGQKSVVYRARRAVDGQSVILKTLKANQATSDQEYRYQREYEVAVSLNIDGVIKPLALEKSDGRPVLVLEDFAGLDLKSILNSRRIEHLEFLRLAVSFTETLGRIHQANIIHKDIKPSNIFYNPDTGQVKIADFGLASQVPRETPGLLHEGLLIGTLAYISPEQTGRMNRLVDWRTDFYSLGVTFYEMLTGLKPFKTGDPLELVHAHIAKMPTPPHEVNQDIPEIVSRIVMKLLSKNAEERYQSAWGLKADLEECLKQFESSGRIEPFPLALHDIPDRFQIPQKLYGREQEIADLMAAFNRVSRGETEFMLVAGEPGIGKTVLVRELYKPITKARGFFISGKFDQYQKNVPYSSIIQAFNELVEQLMSESQAKLGDWKNRIQEAVGNIGQVIIDVIPQVELIIGPQPEVPQLGPDQAQNRFNYVFQNFIRVFCEKEHPLVVFLDDMQWADGASLKFLELMLTDLSIKHFFVIGAYRDNEVNPSHPLLLTIEGLKNDKVEVHEITLSGLKPEQTVELVADTLHQEKAQVNPLAKLVAGKTNGNPFFINEFLKTLYEENLIELELEAGVWTWRLDRINTLNITDNVVQLMSDKINKLEPITQEALKMASAIGNRFDLNRLSMILGNPPERIEIALNEALIEGLLVHLNKTRIELDRGRLSSAEGQKDEYKFVHDRVQQAAYSLFSEAEKAAVHLKIGRLILEHTPFEEREDKIFDIVNQLHQGIELVVNEDERYKIAELNLLAGKRAISSAAWEPALDYLTNGIDLLQDDSWQTHYPLTLSLHEDVVEAAFLSNKLDEMEKYFSIVINNADAVIDKVKVYEMKILSLAAQMNTPEAVQTALEILEHLGVKFTDNPSKVDVLIAYMRSKYLLYRKSIQDLMLIPKMKELDNQAALRILWRLGPPSYMVSQNLWALRMLKVINLSLKYGYTEISGYGYVDYGLFLSSAIGDVELGYKFGKLSSTIVEDFKAKHLESTIIFVNHYFITHWKEHIKNSIQHLRIGYRHGLEVGDLEWASFSAWAEMINSFLIGKELTLLLKECNIYHSALQQISQEVQLMFLSIPMQVVINLMEISENPCRITGDIFDEEKDLPALQKANNKTGLAEFYIFKMLPCYLFGRHEQAQKNSDSASSYIDEIQGMPIIPLFNYFDSLNMLALSSEGKTSNKKNLLKEVQHNQKKMKKWAKHAPMNYLHKFNLVEAERNRVLGKDYKAMGHYDQAIAGAKESAYINDEALANELAAKFYLSKGKKTNAEAYMLQARRCYKQWGAKAKVSHLDSAYSGLLSEIEIAKWVTKDISTTTTSAEEVLDLTSVLKASQAISEEIALGKLLENMISIAIENAGAQKGFLIVETEGRLLIEAEGRSDRKEVKVLQAEPLENSAELCPAIVNYVARTRKNVVLHDAVNKGNFTTDPYIVKNKARSVLCSPLIHQGKVVAIAYFENNLSTEAFTRERLRVLRFLGAQAAISLENARLYQAQEVHARTLEHMVDERTAELKESLDTLKRTQTHLIQSEKMAALGSLVAGVAHEVNTPVGVAVTAASHLEKISRQLTAKVNNDSLKRSDLDQYVKTATDSSQMVLSNLRRASESIQSFKQVAVDQTSEERRKFKLRSYIEDVLLSLRPKLKRTQHTITNNCPDDLELDSYPGYFSQIITNLIMNSLIHGFEGKDQGEITFEASIKDNELEFVYRDNGRGMDEESVEKIFDPFFTTKRGSSGSGLGMHIVYNLVTQTLGGRIECRSSPETGAQFDIKMPMRETDNA